MLFKLAFKNILSRRSSVVIVIFMSFAATLLVVSNAIFDSTEKGVQNSFVASFTGDLIIRPVSDVPLSLFGDETPITGELTEIGKIIPYESVLELIESKDEILGYVPQVSGVAMMEYGSKRKSMSLFGVPAQEYLPLMRGLQILEGGDYKLGEEGMLMLDKVAAEFGVKVGDIIQFTIADGTSFRIRAVPVTGIYSYKSPNAIFERFVLVNPETVRDVMDITETYSLTDSDIDSSKRNLLDDELNFDDLFSSATDVDAIFEDMEVVETTSAQEEADLSSTSWNFIICRTNPEENVNALIRELNKNFEQQHWPVEAVNWRHGAGSTALYLYWMRRIFNIGILIVMAAGFIVVNNTLVVNVLDRTREIGTMRALGATSIFVSLQCMIETLSLALTSGLMGCILGGLISHFLTSLKITFTNEFLIQLFGESALVVSVSSSNVVWIMFLMICLGILGWIYPVLTALRVHPVEAIQGVK